MEMNAIKGFPRICRLYQFLGRDVAKQISKTPDCQYTARFVWIACLATALVLLSGLPAFSLTVANPKVEINSYGESSLFKYWRENIENFLTAEVGCQSTFLASTNDHDYQIAIGYNCSEYNNYNIVFRNSHYWAWDAINALVGADPEGHCPGQPGYRKFLDETNLTDPGDTYDSSTDLTCMKVTLANSMIPGEYFGDETEGHERGPFGGDWINPSAPIPSDSAYTKLLIQSNTDDGSNDFSDSSGNEHGIATTGNVHHEIDCAKFGTSSIAFDGDGDYLRIADSDDWDFGSEDFTIDFWYRDNGTTDGPGLISGGSGLITRGFGDVYRPFSIEVDQASGSIFFYASSDNASWDIANGVSMGTYASGHFNHFAVVRSGNNWFTFKNGTLVESWSSLSSIADDSSMLYIGSKMTAASKNVAGFLDELRISKGKARWVNEFTPSSRSYNSASFSSADYTVYNPFGVPFSFFINNSVEYNGNPLEDISTGQVQQIFSVQAWYWDDLGAGFANEPIVSCQRHAPSSTRALLQNQIMIPEILANSEHDGSAPPYSPPYTVWFNNGSSRMIQSIEASAYSIGYADSTREDTLASSYPNVQALLFNGCAGRKETIQAGTYGFWSKAWVYRDAVDAVTGNLIHKMMGYASRPGNIPASVADYWAALPQISGLDAGYEHTVALKIDGTVGAVGSNSDGQCSLIGWKDIRQVAAGDFHTIGLKTDGTVVAAGLKSSNQCAVSDWKDITQVAAGGYHTVGRRSDGVVRASGNNDYQQVTGTGSWSDIVQVAAGAYHTVGLKSDDTVVAVGKDDDGQVAGVSPMNGWTHIVQVAAGAYHTVGLKSDGTVVATGKDDDGQVAGVIGWTDIIQVAAGAYHTVGLKSDGTVVAVGKNDYGQVTGVGGWTDIGRVAAGGKHIVGQYRFLNVWPDVLAVGDNSQHQTEVAQLTFHPDEDDDGDGLLNGLEQATGTLANDADTDDDGLSDGEEDQNQNGIVDYPMETDPRDNDTDDDGVKDGTEAGIAAGIPDSVGPPCAILILGTDTTRFKADYDPSTTCTDPNNSDSDGDGLMERQEDVNRNGQVDYGETDPCDEDSDDDGYSDGEEVDAGSDPLNPADIPTPVPPIEIHYIDPPTGPENEDTIVTITGANFDPDTVFALYGGGPYTTGLVNTPRAALKIDLSGNYAYVADYPTGLQVIDISNPASPTLVGSWDTPGTTLDVAVSGNYAYVADGQSGLQIIDISDPSSPTSAGSFDTTGYAYGVQVEGSYAYVADSGDGLQVIDISNPASPTLAGACSTGGSALGVYIDGDYAYVAASDFGLQVIDISNPADPTPGDHQDTPGYAVSVFVKDDYAYVACLNGGLQIINISNPADLAFEGACEDMTRVRDVYVTGSRAYVACERDGLKIVDISDPEDPYITGFAETYYPIDVRVSGNYAYVADAAVGLRVIDVSSLFNPSWIGRVDTPHHAYDVQTVGNFAYVADGFSGLQIIDVSDPLDLHMEGTCETEGSAHGVFVSGSYAYVADGDTGLQVIDIQDKRLPDCKGRADTPGSAQDVFVSGNYAYVADYTTGLQVVDVSDKDNPAIVGSYDTQGYALGIYVAGDYAYVADGRRGLQIFNISNPAIDPVPAGACDTSFYASGVHVSGDYAYVADGSSGLQVIDVSDPTDPILVGKYNTPGYALGVFVQGNYAYIADNVSGIQVIDISDPAAPFQVAASDTTGYARNVFVSGTTVYVADHDEGLQLLDAFAPLEDIQYINSGTITATLPAGYSVGDYHLHVSNSSGAYTLDGNIFEIVEETLPETVPVPAIPVWYSKVFVLLALAVLGMINITKKSGSTGAA
jgi:hypothetical protein